MNAPAPLPPQRDLFEIPEGVTYLNCSYMAPQLRAVTAVGESAVRRKAAPWTISAGDFFEPLEELRALVAGFVGGDADGVAVLPSVAYGLSTVAANLTLEPGQRIIVLAEQFPSNVYPWRALAERCGVELCTVERPADRPWTPAVLEAIDERASVVAVPNCHWTDGSLVDLEAVGARARDAGALLAVDASQSLGALPLSVDRIQPDVVLAVSYKWLLGPFGLGFAWFAPRRRAWAPLEQGWNTRAGSEDFAALVDYRDAFRQGARRYDMGQAASFIHVPMTLTALRQVAEWRVDRIAATLQGTVGAIADEAEALGLRATPPPARAPHMIGLRLPDDANPDIADRLARADVHVSVRGRSIRVSPHLYNDAGDVARFGKALGAAL